MALLNGQSVQRRAGELLLVSAMGFDVDTISYIPVNSFLRF